MKALDKLPVATILTGILVAIAAGVGGAVVLAGNLSFQEYLDQLRWFAGAVGLLAVGRGLLKSKPGAEATATVNVPKQPATPGPVSTLTPLVDAPKAAAKKKPPAKK